MHRPTRHGFTMRDIITPFPRRPYYFGGACLTALGGWAGRGLPGPQAQTPPRSIQSLGSVQVHCEAKVLGFGLCIEQIIFRLHFGGGGVLHTQGPLSVLRCHPKSFQSHSSRLTSRRLFHAGGRSCNWRVIHGAGHPHGRKCATRVPPARCTRCPRARAFGRIHKP